ncbi:hypothetical protein COCSUDRAFT_58821 [Coccomyxa subellipsoidea C-169]|uniref:Uncharacterized protein n=1 Tax=Coccomyxa subellipsoidea (strain C-169) TaxID=574566 RepID=I0Z6L1_COCSC|nr:hypothetical protein COCSUDRAFT_58821 [Coccomyxa subellipsoidea C-169]EIE26280.1 hypothetical protein COCSUDRAFT_58821 [Coccomyxa subellipsoidea C-169]|eukprot:XP_005650824.1 hypothetical protein COCSUDRAFT_58821 [Coccomyxa subellipsoidea C-169]
MSPSLDYSSAQHGMDPDDVPFEGPVQTEEKLKALPEDHPDKECLMALVKKLHLVCNKDLDYIDELQEEWNALSCAVTMSEAEEKDLKRQIGRLKEQVNMQEGVMLDQQDDISGLRAEISKLTARIQELELQIKALKQQGTVEIAKESTEHKNTEPADAEDAAVPFRAEEKLNAAEWLPLLFVNVMTLV